MTTVPHSPEVLTTLVERVPRINNPVVGAHHIELATVANHGLLDNPAGRFGLGLLDTSGTYSFSYVRNPGARFLRLEARINPQVPGSSGTVQIDLTIRDAAGHSVSSSSSHIPRGFKAEVLPAPWSLRDLPLYDQLAMVGVLDCDELDGTLTDPSWVFEFVVTFAGGAEINTLLCWEAPRFVVNDAVDHGGVLPGAFQHDQPITDSDSIGLERLLETLVSARQSERTYVSLAWRQQVVVSAETPNTGATSFTQFAALAADSAPQTWRPSPRQVYAGSSAGEALRFRFLYRFSAGAGSETAQVQLTGNASGGSWLSGTLTYTTTWTWSDWITAAIRTSPLSDALALKGKVSATGPLLWIASIHVLEAVT